jgi:hypothetical protein
LNFDRSGGSGFRDAMRALELIDAFSFAVLVCRDLSLELGDFEGERPPRGLRRGSSAGDSPTMTIETTEQPNDRPFFV